MKIAVKMTGGQRIYGIMDDEGCSIEGKEGKDTGEVKYAAIRNPTTAERRAQ
jgi:hypothetical protein